MPQLPWRFIIPLGMGVLPLHSQVVPVQASTDAQNQRRLQAEAQESVRRRRVDENIRLLGSALDPSALAGPEGLPTTRRAMAAMADLANDSLSPRDAIQQAVKKSRLGSSTTQKTSAYLTQCWLAVAGRITPVDLESLRLGKETKNPLPLPPFQP
ncbi:MAG: hypothetical protein EB090_05780 [Verrucomicrobia bacterium]|nr:hypothetical protein [Verrucomicrobiota bacterium]